MAKFFDNPVLLLVLVVIIVLVFGANKLPGAARSLGRSMRIFKSEVRQMKDDDEPGTTSGSATHHGPEAPLEGRVVDDQARRSSEEPRPAPDAPRKDV